MLRRSTAALVAALALGVSGTASIASARTAEGAARPVYYIATRQKVMALTFDVSWGDQMLPRVLDVLKAEHQHATFFLSGPWSRTHGDLVRRIIEQGNEIASHGQAHIDLGGRGEAVAADNIGAADAILRTYTPAPLRFFRPPNGDWDGAVVEAGRGLGYETVIWSIDSLDWMNPGVQTIVSRVRRQTFPGAIILMHASDTCKQTDIALPMVIANARAEGYRLVTLGQLWAMGPAKHDDPRGSGSKPNWPPLPSGSASASVPGPAAAAST